MNVQEPPIIATIAGGAAAVPDGSIDLRKYPQLVYAPGQWGPGIRTQGHGELVSVIAAEAKDVDFVGWIDEIAKKFHLSWDELFDALRYARDHGPL